MTASDSGWSASEFGQTGTVANGVEQAELNGGRLTAEPSAGRHSSNPAASSPGPTAEQLAYKRGQEDAVRRLTTPRMSGWRVVCGICWGLWTLAFTIGALVSLAHASFGSFLIAAVLAGLAGWYDYRIWALKARRLTIFIIF